MFKKGQRLVHKFLTGEYEVMGVDERNIMEVARVDQNFPKSKWERAFYRLDDCKDDWLKVSKESK